MPINWILGHKPQQALLSKQLRNSLSKVEKLENWTIEFVTELTHEISHENTQKTCFSHKDNLKNFEKHG